MAKGLTKEEFKALMYKPSLLTRFLSYLLAWTVMSALCTGLLALTVVSIRYLWGVLW